MISTNGDERHALEEQIQWHTINKFVKISNEILERKLKTGEDDDIDFEYAHLNIKASKLWLSLEEWAKKYFLTKLNPQAKAICAFYESNKIKELETLIAEEELE